MAERGSPDKPGIARDAERRGGMRAIGRSLPKIAGKALGRHGLAEAGLVADWTAIVGERFAEATLPVRLQFPRGERRDGTLHVRVAGALALELQHLAPQLLERINGYLGYRGVERLKIERGPMPRPARRLAEPTAEEFGAAADEAALAETVGAVADPALRMSLARLGRAIGRERKR